MRWDIVEPKTAVTGIDWKQWERIADALGPTVIRPRVPGKEDAYTQTAYIGEGYGRRPESDYFPPATAEQLDARDIQARLLPHRRKARNDFKVGAGLQPYPVYVAKFSDGTTQRLSFWSRAGKPLDFAAGFNVSLVIGRAVPIAGHVESGGVVHIDPHFNGQEVATKARKESAAQRLAAICKALNEGEIEAAMLMARAS